MLAGDKVSAEERERLFTALASSTLLDDIRERRIEQVDAVLQQVVGPQCTCAALGVTL
jgi:hypothetical protein